VLSGLDLNRIPGIIKEIRTMRFCFSVAAVVVMAPAWAADSPDSASAVESVVGIDRRTGRLVRRIMVPEHVIAPVTVGNKRNSSARRYDPHRSGNEKIDSLIDESAARYEVDPLLVHAIIHVESRYNRFALSHKGAEGLMQLIPGTARSMGVANSFDSRQNIEGGVRYLRQLQGRFSDLRHVLAAYNAGPEAVSRWRGIPPYAETMDYVYKVGKKYGELRRSQQDAPSPVQTAAQAVPSQPAHRPIESYIDPEGRLHLRTR